ncbi:MAG: hypothetical protein JSW46_11710 [Gemmatimonadota bacterium]|nr:MAG: hypothetical protein JSW46_11710 [Gemmatimonadota bacterium]
MIAPRTVSLVIALILTAQADLFAHQQPPIAPGESDRAGLAARLVPGILYAGASFGDKNPKFSGKIGPSIGGQFWAPMTSSLAFVLEGVWQPTETEVECPQEFPDDAFSAFYLLGGLEVAVKNAYVRPSVGLVFRSWSGADAPGDEAGFALGFAVGSERPLGGRFHISPELEVRLSAEYGLRTYVFAFQVPVGWRTAGQQ